MKEEFEKMYWENKEEEINDIQQINCSILKGFLNIINDTLKSSSSALGVSKLLIKEIKISYAILGIIFYSIWRIKF